MWASDDIAFACLHWQEILRSRKDLGESEVVGTPGRASAEWRPFRAVAK